MQGKAKDAGGLTPAKDDNAALRALYPRTFARNSDDCYSFAETAKAIPRQPFSQTGFKEFFVDRGDFFMYNNRCLSLGQA